MYISNDHPHIIWELSSFFPFPISLHPFPTSASIADRQTPSASMSYLRASSGSCWRISSTLRQQSLSKARLFPLSQLPPRAGWVQGRGVSTSSSKSESNDANNTRLRYALALSATVAVGILLYRQQSTARMNLLQESKSSKSGRSNAFSVTPTQGDQGALSHVEFYDDLEKNSPAMAKLPREKAILTTAPLVPPPITRDYPVLLEVDLTTTTKIGNPIGQYKYEQWTFNDTVPGPFIRARAGDVVELNLTNKDQTGNPHNIDSHAFTGPGGGAAVTTAEENETKTGRFKLLYPGIYLYHCAAAPVPVHIANGMYGLIYVEPADGGLPPVDHEYYVMQSEFYHEPPEVGEDGRRSQMVEFS